jgi:hypothetical protein
MSHSPLLRFALCAGLVAALPLLADAPLPDTLPHHRAELPAGLVSPPAPLAPSGRLSAPALAESSALLASPSHVGVFWSLNDSGGRPVLFALDASGSALGPGEGFPVPGARNTDWEALAALPDGRLVIGDIGNNANQRRDLALYLWPEPASLDAPAAAPSSETATGPNVRNTNIAAARVAFSYADQTAFPHLVPRHDAEALAWFDDALHLLSKHRADGWTTLYRFAHLDPARPPQALAPLARFHAGSPVTDAFVSADQLRLALLTYRGVWLFTRPAPGLDFWSPPATAAFAPFSAGQCEGLAWLDADTLLLTNEARDVFRLPLSAFRSAGPLTVETLPLLPAAETAPAPPEPAPLAGPPSLILNEYNAVRAGRWLGDDDHAAAGPAARDLRLGRVPGNGGTWLEFVIIAPAAADPARALDLRGASLDWRQADARGTLTFTDAPALAALPRGAILTLATGRELRDERGRIVVAGSRLAFGPRGGPDGWWLHLWTGDTDLVASGHPISDDQGTNEDFQVRLRDRDNRLLMDWTGEGVPPLAGINSREVMLLRADPSPEITPSSPAYGDATRSTFGAPNRWTEGKGKNSAEREQDLAPLRAWWR